MPRHGLYLNEEEDADIIEYLAKHKNVSLHLRNLLKEKVQQEKELDLLKEFEDSKKEIINEMSLKISNLERLIENSFYKMNINQKTIKTSENKQNNKMSFFDGDIEPTEDSNIKI